MMKIRLLVSLAGLGNAIPAGTILEVEEAEGTRLVREGFAERLGYETAKEKTKIENRGVQGNNGAGNGTLEQKRGKKLS